VSPGSREHRRRQEQTLVDIASQCGINWGYSSRIKPYLHLELPSGYDYTRKQRTKKLDEMHFKELLSNCTSLLFFLNSRLVLQLSRYETALRSSNTTQERYGDRLSKYVAYFRELRANFYTTSVNIAVFILYIILDYNIVIYTCK